jgi:hypothetical protein
MTIYLYDAASAKYIGVLNTAWIREQILPGMLIIFEKIKYVVITSEQQSQPYIFNVTVNRI